MTLRFDPVDLTSAYVELLWRQDLFGRTPFGKYVDFEYFILRTRYLLTTDLDAHLADLFAHRQVDPKAEPRISHRHVAAATAAWLAGLQKNRRFAGAVHDLLRELPVRSFVNDSHNQFFNATPAAWFCAALLFDDPEFHVPLLEACRHDSPTTRALALAALEIMDERLGTGFAQAAPAHVAQRPAPGVRSGLLRCLAVSEILTCGFAFDSTAELRDLLARFIATATPVEYQVRGVFAPVESRPYQAWDGNKHARRMEEFGNFIKFTLSRGGRPNPRVVASFRETETSGRPPKPPRRADTFQRLVRDWLDHPEKTPDAQAILHTAAEGFDLAAALEQDILNRLPADLVDALYRKLWAVVSFDAALCREHAYDLLLRSNAHDTLATQLLERADSIESGQQALVNWPSIRMPAGWQPRYPDKRFG